MNPTAYRYQACFWSSDSHLWLQLRKKGLFAKGLPIGMTGKVMKIEGYPQLFMAGDGKSSTRICGGRWSSGGWDSQGLPGCRKNMGSLKSSIFLLGFSINHPPILTLEPIQVVICSRIPELSSGLEIWGSALVWWSSKMKTSTFLGLFTEKMLQNSPRRGRKLNSNPRIVGYCWYQLLLNVMGGYYKSSS